jgi:hypothetical protein
MAIVPSALPTHRYRLRIACITCRGRPLRGPLTMPWDRRRALPQYAKDFFTNLDAYMREVFPISRPSGSKAGTKAKR